MVDEVYVINLDRAKERMAGVDAQCRRAGIDYTRIPAVDGRNLSPTDLKRAATPLCKTLCTPAMIGCALSHMRCWRKMVRDGRERVLIMEDDAKLVDDFVPRLQTALADVPVDFDVLLCGCFYLCNKNRRYPIGHELLKVFTPGKRRNDTRTWGTVFVPEFFAGSHCYVVSNKGARKLLTAIPRVSFHVDLLMNHPDIDLYAVSPDLSFQGDMSTSSIATYSFPKTFGPLLSNVKDGKGIPLSYYLDAPFMQVGGKHVNGWAIIFLVLGLLRWRAFPAVAGVFVAEIVVQGDVIVPMVTYTLGWALAAGVVRIK